MKQVKGVKYNPSIDASTRNIVNLSETISEDDISILVGLEEELDEVKLDAVNTLGEGVYTNSLHLSVYLMGCVGDNVY